MSFSPATPAKTPFIYTNGAHTTSSGKAGRHYSFPESSPASTFGETPSGSNQPMTPLDGPELGIGRANHHGVHLASISELGSTIYGSPTLAKMPYRLAAMERPGNSYDSVSGFPTARDLGLTTEQVDQGRMATKSTKPSDGPTMEFVLQDRSSQAEDPFTVVTTPTRRTRSANVTPSKRTPIVLSSTHTTPSSKSSGQIKVIQQPLTRPSPRQDRLAEEPTAENIQGLRLPDCTVFVANLLTSASDTDLEHAVSEVFKTFGQCFTKIRRRDQHGRNMPNAFVTYEAKDIAARAIIQGRGALILGRPCRTELARAHRAVYVSKQDGGDVIAGEVLSILEPYGAIVDVFEPTPTEHEIHGFPQGGMFFRFAYHQDCMDAQAALRNHDVYRFEQRTEPQRELASRRASRRLPPGSSDVSPAQRRHAEADRRPYGSVIYVGNLSHDINYQTLAQIFGGYGNILSCHIVMTLPDSNRVPGVHALIEFEVAGSAIAAMKASDARRPLVIGGGKLDVRLHNAGPMSMHSSMSPCPPSYGVQQQAWTMPGVLQVQPHAVQGYNPSMSTQSTPMSFYSMSTASTPMSPASMQSGYAQYASQYGYGSSNPYGVHHGFVPTAHGQHMMTHDFHASQLAEGR